MKIHAASRILYLEGARGIASILVIFHHFILAFKPELTGPFPGGLGNTPLYLILNGAGAVSFFFALSGFVLSVNLVRKPEIDALTISLVKRLPRLAFPAGLSILVGYIVLAKHLNFGVEAARISQSDWLRNFGRAQFPVNVDISVLDALRQCIAVFLIKSDFYYNSNLWTMRWEFFGSLFAMVFAYCAGRFVSHSNVKLVSLIVGAALIATFFEIQNLSLFAAGTIIAFVWVRHSLALSRPIVTLLFLCSLIGMCAFSQMVNNIAAVLLLFAMVQSPTAERLLSTRAGYWLGQFSFPIYLVHTLTICSISSYVYAQALRSGHDERVAISFAVATTLIVTFIAAMPLVVLERWWVPFLNRSLIPLKNLLRTRVFSAAQSTQR